MAVNKYRIEIWNPVTRRYEKSWEGLERYARTMMNKPYKKQYRRRLIQITEEVLFTAKQGEYIE